MIRTPSVVAALALVLAPFRSAAQEVPGVRPGDQVITDFYTAGGEQLVSVEGTRLVDSRGNLFFPYVGTVHVDGLNAEQIRTLLAEKYQPFYNEPVITVNVQLRVNITGVVGQPGHYFLDPTTTIVDALAIAGGIGSEIAIASNGIAANAANVRLVRDRSTIVLDMRPEIGDPTALEMRVQSGDWIHVPPMPRSRVRDEIQFWGSVLSFVAAIAATVTLIQN